MGDEPGESDAMINVQIKCNNADKADICIPAAALVSDLKAAVETKLAVTSAQQRLIYKGKILKDDISLQVYNIEEGSIIHMVKGLSRNGDGSAAVQQPSSSAATPASGSSPSFAPPGGAANPFMGMGMGGMMDNPDTVLSLLDTPIMQNMLNDPETFRNLMMSNPQMQSMMDSNPQLRHVLSDPSVLRQTMEMMRNPNAMREAMRSQDLAISHLESVPGGFNALRRMYEEVQEPMMEATQNGSLFGSPIPASTTNSSSPPLTAPTTSALPNPWANAANTNAAPNMLGSMGMGGLGMAGMGMGGQNPSAMAAMMSNPQYQQMMQQMLSNPAALAEMSAMNPQLGAMLQNPQARAMLSSPETLRMLSDPQAVQAMMNMEQSMRTLQSRGFNMPGMPPMAPAQQTPGALGNLDFSSILGGGAAPGVFRGAVQQPVADPATTYANELRQLQDMGFTNQQANVGALVRANGNVNSAVEFLLAHM